MKTTWETYEDVARYILDEFRNELALKTVEGKQRLPGEKSGTIWEIDALGTSISNDAVILIECKRHTTNKLNQETLAGLAYRIEDTGSDGGIIVSPLGLQTGAEKIAKSENIINVKLHENSAPEAFCVEFLDKVFHRFSGNVQAGNATVGGSINAISTCEHCGKSFTKRNGKTVCDECNA